MPLCTVWGKDIVLTRLGKLLKSILFALIARSATLHTSAYIVSRFLTVNLIRRERRLKRHTPLGHSPPSPTPLTLP